VTDHPGEQFPPSVDPDVEPQPEGSPVSEPDYDAEPEPDTDPAYDAVSDPVAYDGAQAPVASYDTQQEAEPSYRDEGRHPLVEETMARLDDLRERPVSEHAEIYADVHERLQTALVEADAEHGDRA
jgi:hypothetical protein